MLKKIFSHTAIYGLAPQITMVVNFFLLPFITSELTEIDFGVQATIITYSTALSALASLGLRVNIVNSFYKSPNQYKWAWRQFYGFLYLWNFIFAFIFATVIYFIVPQEATENRWTIVLLVSLPYIVMSQTGLFGRTYYQLNQKPVQIAVRSLIFGLLTAGLNYVFIVQYKMGYMGWFWSTFISTILSNLSYWYALNIHLKLSPIFNFKRKSIRKALKVSLPSVPHFYSGFLLNSSQIMIMDKYHIPTADIGKYQAANTFGVIADGFSTAIGWTIGPMLNQKYKLKQYREARNLIYLIQVLFFTITFIACIWLKEIFYLMIRNEVLNQMYYLGIILIMSINYRPMYLGAVSNLIYNEKTNVLWKLSLVAGVINVIGNLVLVPIYGYEVSALIVFLSFHYMGYAGYYYKVYKIIEKENFFPLLWLALSILLCVSAYWIVEMSWVVKTIISIFSLGVSIIAIAKLNKKITV